jgi:Zn-dependent proteases
MDFLERFLWYPLDHLPFIVIVLALAFTFHEFAHAYSAYKFGDPTARDQGRVTLNPMAHLDPLGTILLLIAGFGWAKPVPVVRSRFRYPRLMGIVVSAVGPLSNLLLAFAGVGLWSLFAYTGWLEGVSIGAHKAIYLFLNYLININVLLFIFNLIPLPPLDGYRIVEDLSPPRVREKLDRYAQWGVFIFLLIVFIPDLRAVTLEPLFSLTTPIVFGMFSLFGLSFLSN